MKNLSLILFVFFILFLASCSKEEVILQSELTEESAVFERSTTIEIEVSKVTYNVDGGEMDIHFSASYDFSEAVLESMQYLKFQDASGNLSTLVFQTQHYTGANGTLDVTLLVGSNNLAGLTLTSAQEVIIEDIVPE